MFFEASKDRFSECAISFGWEDFMSVSYFFFHICALQWVINSIRPLEIILQPVHTVLHTKIQWIQGTVKCLCRYMKFSYFC